MNESEKFLQTSLENVKGLIDVNKVIGNAIVLENGKSVIPITEVKVSFIAGGSEFGKDDKANYPFGGLSGGNISMKPTGFLILDSEEIRLLEIKKTSVLETLLLDEIPALISKLNKK